MWRLFIAIHLPDEIKARLVEAQAALRRRAPPGVVRWSPLEQVHLTLRFLGDVPEDAVPLITEALHRACAAIPSFELRAAGLGCFPGALRPRVLWAGVGGDAAALTHLHERIAVESASWARPEEREFRAHLTLGRIKDGRGREFAQLAETVMKEAGRDFGSWRVTTVALMRSELSSSGARHSVVAESTLAADLSAA